MRYRIFQIDAFTDKVFQGNPAAVIIMDRWPEDAVLQRIAAENNLAETAFVIPDADGYCIRWFTPKAEVDLCGHATLAAAFVLYEYYFYSDHQIHFCTKNSGPLFIRKNEDLIAMNFPVDKFAQAELPEPLKKAFGKAPLETYKGKTDYMLVYETEEDVAAMKPNFDLINQVDCRGVVVTAPGNDSDFVSRFFAPQLGIPEDPVTGSTHTTLTPYWAKRLNKTVMKAKQLSERTGEMICRRSGERIFLEGKAVAFLEGEIEF